MHGGDRQVKHSGTGCMQTKVYMLYEYNLDRMIYDTYIFYILYLHVSAKQDVNL